MLSLVKGHWKGLDFAMTGYSEAKKRVYGELRGQSQNFPIDVPLDAVAIK